MVIKYFIGNSFNDDERMLCSGYDNGDVKMFDLRNMNLLWETNIKNGVFYFISKIINSYIQ